MLYPFKFKPVFKDYIWGGRNLEKLGKVLPAGIIAESWEVSCHPNGISRISNGQFSDSLLTDLIQKFGRQIIGTALPEEAITRFPLLVKLIDANERLSVQVHPDDAYAFTNENGDLGKNEMWYIISAKPGAQLIYDVIPGTTQKIFTQAVKEDKIENYLKLVEVFPGDIINIPPGLIHAIGEGIVLAEIQQNSDLTYRVYDYNRVDKDGNHRPLHIKKALEVIDFNSSGRRDKVDGLTISFANESTIKYLVANRNFAVELIDLNGLMTHDADGSKFYIYLLTVGEGIIKYNDDVLPLKTGESILIPAALGRYTFEGNFSALKTYVPDLSKDIIAPLQKAGYAETDIYTQVIGDNIITKEE